MSKTKLLSLILLILTLSSSAQTQIATGASSPSGLVVVGDYIYTVNLTNSSLVRANKTQVGTNNFETVVSNIARSGNQGNICASGESIYTPGIAYGTMTYTDVSAGVVFPVYSSPYILNMSYSVSNVFYYNGLNYIANSANGSAELFEHYSSTGGNLIATLPVDYQYISDVTTDGSIMYFSTTTGAIYQIDLAATTPVATLVTSGLSAVKGIHFADDYLYYLSSNQVRKVHKSTLVVTTVSSVPGNGVAMEIDGYDIYVANSNGNIYKINDPDFAPCTVTIPDTNFKAALVADTGINTNGNTEIECTEATAFTGTVNVFNDGIFDLTGIEAFTNITGLNCGNNSLTSLDVSANTALITLGCGFNSLSSLDVSNNLALETLTCLNNQITSLDVSANTALSSLICSTNFLSSLNLANGNNAALTSLTATSNAALSCIQIDAGFTPPSSGWIKDTTASYSDDCSVTSCTVTIPDANFKAYLVGNTAINTNGDTEIQCTEANVFTGQINVNNLNISDLTGIEAFINLTELLCRNNSGLTTVDVSNNTQLTALGLNNNNLTSLDVSNNSLLTELYCASNQLTSLNLANGNNGSLVQMDACCNSNATTMNTLVCIQIDSGFTPPSSGWQKEITTSYSTNCSALSVDDFTIQNISIYPNPVNNTLNIQLEDILEKVEVYSILGAKVIEHNNSSINVSKLASGMYLLKVYTEKGKVGFKRFIKED
ncbi:T9SS type A sorting domain-containing protein [Polaribacter vadi]|uniref:T9SS type A sorting domain-containing protein n=1 Tax=Polaribacter TaxID=52959 RepID=UPI001C090DC8|nr:T9SS type A sorting domain-containing protein [Polaribacter sp. 1_MG-2023]MBU3012335.1 T9SS type A sorting domain-containing protein [Polaribacter vadi]